MFCLTITKIRNVLQSQSTEIQAYSSLLIQFIHLFIKIVWSSSSVHASLLGCISCICSSSLLFEQVISQVRTVYSFVGEDRAIEAYSMALNKALKFGKRSGFATGIGVGFTYGLLFCAWALLLWYAGILVRHGDTNGGKAFTTIINVIFSGL